MAIDIPASVQTAIADLAAGRRPNASTARSKAAAPYIRQWTAGLENRLRFRLSRLGRDVARELAGAKQCAVDAETPAASCTVLSQPVTCRFHDVSDAQLATFQAAGLLVIRVPCDNSAPALMTHLSVDITFPPGTSAQHRIGGDFGPSRWALPVGIVVEQHYQSPPRLVECAQLPMPELWTHAFVKLHVAAIRKEWGAVWPHIGRDLRSALVDARVTVALAGLDRETVAVTAIDALREALHRAMETGGFAP